MNKQKKKTAQRKKRAFRVKNAFTTKASKLRIVVSRSLKHIGAQIIDDARGITVASFSSIQYENNAQKEDKVTRARNVGLELGAIAKKSSIEHVFFDRGKFLYHGRVKALAEGLRESGLQF